MLIPLIIFKYIWGWCGINVFWIYTILLPEYVLYVSIPMYFYFLPQQSVCSHLSYVLCRYIYWRYLSLCTHPFYTFEMHLGVVWVWHQLIPALCHTSPLIYFVCLDDNVLLFSIQKFSLLQILLQYNDLNQFEVIMHYINMYDLLLL